jgi:hypothetical protein
MMLGYLCIGNVAAIRVALLKIKELFQGDCMPLAFSRNNCYYKEAWKV